jgi:hypothetical protein
LKVEAAVSPHHSRGLRCARQKEGSQGRHLGQLALAAMFVARETLYETVVHAGMGVLAAMLEERSHPVVRAALPARPGSSRDACGTPAGNSPPPRSSMTYSPGLPSSRRGSRARAGLSPPRSGTPFVKRPPTPLLRRRATAPDQQLPLTNNHSERALRGIAVGRRAWLFFGSDDHASAGTKLGLPHRLLRAVRARPRGLPARHHPLLPY